MKTNKFYLLLFYLIFFAYPFSVLSKNDNAESESQLTVEADESLEWFEKEKYYLAKGNDLLTKDGLRLNANKVKANYEDFDLSKKVEITKKARNFILKTNSLIGTLKKGNFFTNDKVDIVSGNIRINGEGLDLKRNGEYIKIKGKAKLIMILSTKNEN